MYLPFVKPHHTSGSYSVRNFYNCFFKYYCQIWNVHLHGMLDFYFQSKHICFSLSWNLFGYFQSISQTCPVSLSMLFLFIGNINPVKFWVSCKFGKHSLNFFIQVIKNPVEQSGPRTEPCSTFPHDTFLQFDEERIIDKNPMAFHLAIYPLNYPDIQSTLCLAN